MRKRILTVLITLVSTINAFAQNPGHKFEIGAGYAPFFVSSVDDGINCPYRLDAFFEYRYDFGKHIDVGAKLDYKVSPASCDDRGDGVIVGYKGYFHVVGLYAVSDINFNPGGVINPFIGLGLGPALDIDNMTSVTVQSLTPEPAKAPEWAKPRTYCNVFPALTARAGVEIMRHLRIAFSVDAYLEGFESPACISVGWTF